MAVGLLGLLGCSMFPLIKICMLRLYYCLEMDADDVFMPFTKDNESKDALGILGRFNLLNNLHSDLEGGISNLITGLYALLKSFRRCKSKGRFCFSTSGMSLYRMYFLFIGIDTLYIGI